MLIVSTFVTSLGLLTACDSGTDSGAIELNTAPVADAGADITVSATSAIALDGSRSYDSDGDELIYTWFFEHLPEGSALAENADAFSDNASAKAVSSGFTPDGVGTYVLGLVVNDGTEDSAPDYLIVTVEAPADIPIANAGADQVVSVGETVSLDGSGSSDVNQLELNYSWSMVQKPATSGLSTTDLTGALPT